MTSQEPEPPKAAPANSGQTATPHHRTPSGLPRARSLGLRFRGTPGNANAITDVPGIEVGYETLIRQDDVRTGVTAIHPRGKASPGDPVAAGFHSQNGNGGCRVTWTLALSSGSGHEVFVNTA